MDPALFFIPVDREIFLQAFPEVLTVFGRQFFRPVALGAELAHEEAQDGRFLHKFQAADQVAVMNQLGLGEFSVVAHDRGARVTHRMLLDHPEAVTRAALLDILPTKYVYDHTDRALATAYFHWFFFIQPAPLPELMMESNATLLLKAFLGAFGGTDCYDPAAMAEYERCFATPEAIHAMCEDYRAAASIDLVHDAADLYDLRPEQISVLPGFGDAGFCWAWNSHAFGLRKS